MFSNVYLGKKIIFDMKVKCIQNTTFDIYILIAEYRNRIKDMIISLWLQLA